MRKSLTKYKRNLPVSGTTLILVGVAVIGLIIWFIVKSKSVAQYQNIERWEIIRNEKGFATGITVHRNATQG